MQEKIEALVRAVQPLDQKAMLAAEAHQARLAKPPGSLGRLEELSVQLAGITGKVHNELPRKQLLVFAADNGVVAEGVSSAPQSVTMQQTINLTRGKTGAAVLAKRFGCGLTVCDVGVNADLCESAVLNRKIAYGTQNICAGPAMTREQALQAILTGAAVAENIDADAVGIGEMGIGNTTTSSAVLCALSGESVEAVTGRGGGLTDAAFGRKKQVIEQALAVNRPDADDPIDVLCKVGGFDLCAMTGVFLGAAHARLPVVVDGFISIVAALCAARLCENARGFFFGSHVSYERGYKVAEQLLGLQPCLQLGMRLGEGSGCPLAFRVIEAACAVISTMATFPEAAIDDTYLTEIREKDSFTV